MSDRHPLAVPTAVALLLLASTSGAAPPPDPDPLTRGREAFAAGDYGRAQALLTEARDAGSGGPIVLCYLGRTAAAQGRLKEAIDLLKAYRKAGAEPRHGAWLRMTLQGLRSRLAGPPGRLEVWSAGTSGGRLALDGKPVGPLPQTEVDVPPGPHEVAVTLADGGGWRGELLVRPGEHLPLMVTPPPPGPPAKQPTGPSPEPTRRPAPLERPAAAAPGPPPVAQTLHEVTGWEGGWPTLYLEAGGLLARSIFTRDLRGGEVSENRAGFHPGARVVAELSSPKVSGRGSWLSRLALGGAWSLATYVTPVAEQDSSGTRLNETRYRALRETREAWLRARLLDLGWVGLSPRAGLLWLREESQHPRLPQRRYEAVDLGGELFLAAPPLVPGLEAFGAGAWLHVLDGPLEGAPVAVDTAATARGWRWQAGLRWRATEWLTLAASYSELHLAAEHGEGAGCVPAGACWPPERTWEDLAGVELTVGITLPGR